MGTPWKNYKSNFEKVKETLQKESVKQETDQKESWKFNPKLEGDSSQWRIRFLPLENSATGKHWVELRIHMFNRAGDNKRIKCIDPTTFDKKAKNPIAKLGWDLYKSDNALDKKQSSNIRSKLRIFTLIYIKSAPETQKDLVEKVIPFECGEQIKKIIEASIKDFDLDFTHPVEGTDFLLNAVATKDQSGKVQPSYTASVFDRKNSQIAKDEDEMNRVWEQVQKYNYEKFKEYVIEKLGGIPDEQTLESYLNGGLSNISNPAPAKTQTNVQTPTGTSIDTNLIETQTDFGDPIDPPHPIPRETPKQETKLNNQKIQTTSTPEEVKVDEMDINFADADFNIDV